MNPLLLGVLTLVLGVAALLTTIRIVRGPSVVDRAVAADVLVTILCVGLAVEAAVFRHASTLPVLVSVSLLGFVGSVAVARFVARDRDPGAPAPRLDAATGRLDPGERPRPAHPERTEPADSAVSAEPARRVEPSDVTEATEAAGPTREADRPGGAR